MKSYFICFVCEDKGNYLWAATINYLYLLHKVISNTQKYVFVCNDDKSAICKHTHTVEVVPFDF